MDSKMRDALDVAWEKIQRYCQQYAGRSIRDVQIRWKHEIFGWCEFGVTSNGEAYINGGNHSQSSRGKDTAWVGHPEHNDPYENCKYGFIEKVVRDWPIIKDKLEMRFEEERLIFAFEP